MKTTHCIFLLFLIIASCIREGKNEIRNHQGGSIFPKGEKLISNNFKGTVWLYMMGATDSTLHTSFGHVTFEPGARTNWHSHPGGQILFITQGKGCYQAKGQPARLLQAGDYVEIPPDVVHWHGATPDSEFAHIAVSLNTDKGGVIWLNAVTDDEYNKAFIVSLPVSNHTVPLTDVLSAPLSYALFLRPGNITKPAIIVIPAFGF